MKKFLLFSAAVLTAAAATAANPAGVRVYDRDAKSVATDLFEGKMLKADNSVNIARPVPAANAVLRSGNPFFKDLTAPAAASRAGEEETDTVIDHPFFFPQLQNYVGYLVIGGGDATYLIFEDAEGNTVPISRLAQPVYTELRYSNASTVSDIANIDSAFTWYYSDYNVMAEVDTVAVSLTTPPQPYTGRPNWVVLQMNDSLFYETASQVYYGGTNYYAEEENVYTQGTFPFNLGDPANTIAYASYFALNSTLWSQIYNAQIGVTEIGNVLRAPEHPYGVTSVIVRGVFDKMVSDSLVVNITKLEVDADGRTKFGEVLGSGYLTRAEIEAGMKANYYRCYEIPLCEIVDGERVETWINVDCPVFVSISGVSAEAGDEIYLCASFTADEDILNYCSTAALKAKYNGSDLLLDASLTFNNGKTNTAFAVGLDNMYTFLDPATEATAYTSAPAEYTVPNEGGDIELVYEPYYDLQSVAYADGEGCYEWWYDNYGDYNEETGQQTCTITVDALPEGVSGRQSKVRIEIPGAYRDIVITQGAVSGLNAIQASAADVKIANGIISVNGRGNVEVYSLSGRKVKSAVSNGSATIDANNLPAGVYLVKVGNKVAKVVK